MTNDGWGKAKGWGKPEGWTTQQAVDKAVEALETGPGGVATALGLNKSDIKFLLARDVKLNLNSKIFTVDAIQVGDLAIWDDGDFFAISHVPTLAKFMNAVPTIDDKEYTNDQVVLWCTKVQRSHQEEWAILRTLTPQNYSTKNTEAAEAALRIREWCLSVPIE